MIVGCLSVALIGPTALGSRTVCLIAPLHLLVQHQIAPAQRYALPLGLQGKPTVYRGSALRWKCQQRSTRKPDEPSGREAGRSHLVLNRSAVWREATDRARAKPGGSYEGDT